MSRPVDIRARARIAARAENPFVRPPVIRKPASVTPTECDCGNALEPGHEACSRCEYLDQNSVENMAGMVIEALRDYRWLTRKELAALCGTTDRSVFRALRYLRDQGRIESVLVEEDDPDGSAGWQHYHRDYYTRWRTVPHAAHVKMHCVHRLSDSKSAVSR